MDIVKFLTAVEALCAGEFPEAGHRTVELATGHGTRAVDALIRAQRRAVKIRVLMDNTNLVDIPNPGFRRLRATFRKVNKTLPMKRRS